MILLSILLRLNVAETFNQIEPKVCMADELKSGIVAQDEYIINLRPYFAQKMRGSCFSIIWNEMLLKSDMTVQECVDFLTKDLKTQVDNKAYLCSLKGSDGMMPLNCYEPEYLVGYLFSNPGRYVT